jgi:Ankyrin repeats (3 copies)
MTDIWVINSMSNGSYAGLAALKLAASDPFIRSRAISDITRAMSRRIRGDSPATIDSKVSDSLLKLSLRDQPAKTEIFATIHTAAAFGTSEHVASLLSCSSGVNELDDLGETPLLHACRSGNLDTVKALIKHGANSNLATELADAPGLRRLNTCTRCFLRTCGSLEGLICLQIGLRACSTRSQS